MENNYDEKILEKWKVLVEACKNYYIDSIPTGISDGEYDSLEEKAIREDKFFVRDYIFQTYSKGKRSKNSWIEKIKKEKVEGKSMLEALVEKQETIGRKIYCDLKYDGSSIAIYLDPYSGVPKRVVTVGNLNIDNYGVDQTWKLLSFLPKRFPKGIVAIQCEALIDLDRFSSSDPDTARQKANGLVNSTKQEAQAEVNSLLTLRAYRYYIDPACSDLELGRDYRNVLKKFETIRNPVDGHIVFAPADVWTVDELSKFPGYTETDRTTTSTGTFLNDGWVVYDEAGTCLGALKYSGAGSGTEAIKTKVSGIQWNNQSSKGKDSWSANVIIDPVTVRGCTIRKPSAGSVSKLVKKNITPEAIVGIVLANSTIPMVGEVFSPGNGDFQWPVCSCGYQMSENDIYGSLLKCGNPRCSDRENRMKAYLSGLKNVYDLDLNKYLVIDRFKWESTSVSVPSVLKYIEDNDIQGFYTYLSGFLSTSLQKRNLDLVYQSGFYVLRELYENTVKEC